MDPKLERYHRPDRTFVLSGISRSGTSLLSVIINEVPNAVCFNEVLTPDPKALPEALARIRRDLIKGRPVPNKFDESGRLATNTLDGVVTKEKRRVGKPLDENVVVGSKRNIPYLNVMEELLDHGFKAVVMVRDPVYTIGSWSSPKAAEARIPGALVSSDDVHPHWNAVRFSGQDVIERRAEAWQHHAAHAWDLRDSVKILTYEKLCLEPDAVLEELCVYLELRPPRPAPTVAGPPRNDDSRYPEIPRIRQAVRRLCSARKHFGYD